MNIALVGDEPLGVRATIVSDEDTYGPACRHIAFLIVLRALRRHLPENRLSEADEALAECSAAGSCPRSQSVRASGAGVEDE